MLSAILPPTHCPECASMLEIFTDKKSQITTRWCNNVECPGRVRALFTFVGGRDILEIDGLADETSGKLVNGYARNLGELFTFQTEALKVIAQAGEDRFVVGMVKKGFSITILKTVRSMENAKTAPWPRWIAALGIPLVGRTLGKVLAKELSLEAGDMKNLPAKLEEIAKRTGVEGMGTVRSDTLTRWSLDPVNRQICQSLYDAGVRPTPLPVTLGQPLSGLAFVITGTFSEDRDGLTKKLESLGATSKSSVSKNVNIVIAGANPGGKKVDQYNTLKAKGVKIEMVGQEWLDKTFEDCGIATNAQLDTEEV
jgi:DNA ligase (NAD+)